MIPTDLFEFAYVPDWYGQLDELADCPKTKNHLEKWCKKWYN